MKLLPALATPALLALALLACGGPNASTGRSVGGGSGSPSSSQLDPETLIDTITHGDEVTLSEYLPDDESIPTIVLFTADW